MVGSLSITLILLTFLLSHDGEHFDAHLASFIYYMTKKLKPSAWRSSLLWLFVCQRKGKIRPGLWLFFEKKNYQAGLLFLFFAILT